MESAEIPRRIEIIGDMPFSKDAKGRLRARIGTAFPRRRALVTLPGIHATQRQAFVERLNATREKAGLPPLTSAELDSEWSGAVDLIIDEDAMLIRPDPGAMPLAFAADEMLREIIPTHKIKFLGVLNEKVREAIKSRGEWWRITPLPKSAEEMRRMIEKSRIAIRGREIYFYSTITGTRFLTFQNFADLDSLDDPGLRAHLQEIQEYFSRANAHGNPELAFFTSSRMITRAELLRLDFRGMDGDALRSAYKDLRERFLSATREQLRVDDLENVEWRNSLVAALIGRDYELVTEETLLGLSPEFFMQIEWLPGGRIEGSEFFFEQGDAASPSTADEKPQKFIFNYVREYGDLEYVNMGRVIGSLSQRRAFYGRRGVYIAVLKQRRSAEEIVNVIRMQKEGVREYLEQGYSMLEAMIRAEDYTEYIMDRRLACRQVGMNLPLHVTAKRISERFICENGEDCEIWVPYFEREYIRGMATDKLPLRKLAAEGFATVFAGLLGRAAAPNLIVGRCDLTGAPLFDDGDEILDTDEDGSPKDIIVADHTGAFNDYATLLAEFAADYAAPVNRRVAHLANPKAFAAAYLHGLESRIRRIQEDYRQRQRAFDTLFQYRPRRAGVTFAYRWERVLERLKKTDAGELAELLREKLEL
jgi:hypothetical protein